MSYHIPASTKAHVVLGVTKIGMKVYTPQSVSKLAHAIVTMFLRGHIGLDFDMKINVYADEAGEQLLFSSNTINNQDITRIGDYYCELRFDFPDADNRLSLTPHLVEFEVFGGYTYDATNFLALILEGSPLTHRCSLFSLKR